MFFQSFENSIFNLLSVTQFWHIDIEGFTFNITQSTMSPRLTSQSVFYALFTFPLVLGTALAQHSESAQIELWKIPPKDILF